MTILLCDAGGTHARFALSKDGKTMSEPQKLKIADYPDFASIAEHFLHTQKCDPEKISEIRFALKDRNPWPLDEQKIQNFLPNASIKEINDFESNAYGVAFSADDHFMLLNKPTGKQSRGSTKVIIGIGTGLGLSNIIDPNKSPRIQRNYGGHMIPAVATKDQFEIYESLKKYKSDDTDIIYEDLLSGPGMWHLYLSACEAAHTHAEYSDTNDMINRGRNDPLVQQTLKIFHENLGIFAHQAVHFSYGYEGLYLTGGIIDRLFANNLWDQESFDQYFRIKNVPIVMDDVNATPTHTV